VCVCVCVCVCVHCTLYCSHMYMMHTNKEKIENKVHVSVHSRTRMYDTHAIHVYIPTHACMKSTCQAHASAYVYVHI
jgi:hypothetical protein